MKKRNKYKVPAVTKAISVFIENKKIKAGEKKREAQEKEQLVADMVNFLTKELERLEIGEAIVISDKDGTELKVFMSIGPYFNASYKYFMNDWIHIDINDISGNTKLLVLLRELREGSEKIVVTIEA